MATEFGLSDLSDGLREMRSVASRNDPIATVDAVRLAEKLIDTHGGSSEPVTATAVAQLRIERGKLLEALGHPADAAQEFSTVAAQFPHHWVGAEALDARSQLHHRLGNDLASLADLSLLDERYAESEEVEAQRFRALAHDFRLQWLADDASSSSAAGPWLDVIEVAQSIHPAHHNEGDEGDEGDETIQRCLAHALLWEARAWRAIAAGDDADDHPQASTRARHCADTLFDRYAHQASSAFRDLVASSESENIRTVDDPAETLALTERIITLRREWADQPASLFADAGVRRGRALRSLGHSTQAYEGFASVVADYRDATEPDVIVSVAWAWAECVDILHTDDRTAAALVDVDRFALWAQTQPVASDLEGLRGALCSALSTRVDILHNATPPPTSTASAVGGAPVPADSPHSDALALDIHESAYAAAVADLTSRFAHDPNDAIRTRVASQVFDLAHHQRTRNHFTEAEATYRVLVNEFADDTDALIRDTIVAPAELNLGFLLLSLLGRPADAVAVYDAALARIGDTTSPRLRALVAKLNSSRATAITLLHDSGLSVTDLEEDTLGAEAREDIRRRVLQANALTDAGDFAAAVEIYRAVIAEHPHPTGPDLRRRICDVMVRMGHCLNRLTDWLDSVAFHHRFLDEFGTDVNMTIEKDVALGLSNLATALDRLGRHEEEIDAYERILRRWADSDVPYLRDRCARASWRKGATEYDLGRTQDAEQTYTAGARYLRDESVDTRIEAAKSGVNLSVLQRKLNRPDDAVRSARVVVDALSSVTASAAREQLAKAYLALARAQAEHGDVDDACTSYEWLLGEGAPHISVQLRATVNEEFLQLVGGPFKGAWRRLTRGRRGTSG